VFWVVSVYFNIRNTLLKYGRFLLGHPVYRFALTLGCLKAVVRANATVSVDMGAYDFFQKRSGGN
jgi:hypothetical protein